MRGRVAIGTALTTAALLGAVPALAQVSPSEVAAEARDRGFFVEDGVSVDESRISDAVARAGTQGIRFYVVILDEDPSGGAGTFAGAVLDRIGSGTVLVLSASEEGMESTRFSGSTLERALDAGFEAGGGDEGYLSGVVDSLTGAVGGTTDTPGSGEASDGGGSNTGLFILLAMVGGLVLLVVFVVRRQKKAAERSEERSVEEARREIKGQLDAMANTILDITDRVSASESKEDNQFLEDAGSTYSKVLEEFEGAGDLRTLEALSDRLDEARWQLDAAAALADGKPAPPKPKKEERPVCFFDPTHQEAVEEAEIRTEAGTKRVRVCKEDAEKLRKGREPKPRMIEVEGRRVPAPMAPRSYGGGGFDWLDVFSVVLGGMGQTRSYDWSRSRRRGVFGSSRRSRRSSSPSTGRASTRSRAGRIRRRRR
jgi:hypothetical protein